MNKSIRNTVIAGSALALLVPFLSRCSTKTFPSQCAFVIGDGAGDSRTVKKVVLPGQSGGFKADDNDRFVPCNARNYRITDDKDTGDRHDPVRVRIPASKDGKLPATEVSIYVSVYWTLNQDEKTLRAFFPFCQKYDCTSSTSELEDEGKENFASPGWNGMLRENMGPAINRAFTSALQGGGFAPDIWKNQSAWQQLAEAVSGKPASSLLLKELSTATGSGNYNFFCGNAADRSCPPPKVVVEKVVPSDNNLITLDRQGATAQALNAQRLEAAIKLYGTKELAGYALMIQDAIERCNAKPGCTIYIGDVPRR